MKNYYNKLLDWFKNQELKIQIKIIILIIIGLIIFDLIYAHICLTQFGGYPVAGYTGLIIGIFLSIISGFGSAYLFARIFRTKNIDRIWPLILLSMILSPFIYPYLYNNCYTEMLRKIYLSKSHIEYGKVYKIYRRTGKGESGYAVIVGIDEKHTMKHRIYENHIAANMNVGDNVLLKVSDRYPRVNEIIECNGLKLREGDEVIRTSDDYQHTNEIEINDIKLE